MPKYSKSFVKVNDPYSILALNIFLESFKDIECYFNGIGTIEERTEGKKSIQWIMEMKGNFKILAMAGEPYYTVEEVHQLCIRKINELKRVAYNKQLNYVKHTMGQKNIPSTDGREGDFELV